MYDQHDLVIYERFWTLHSIDFIESRWRWLIFHVPMSVILQVNFTCTVVRGGATRRVLPFADAHHTYSSSSLMMHESYYYTQRIEVRCSEFNSRSPNYLPDTCISVIIPFHNIDFQCFKTSRGVQYKFNLLVRENFSWLNHLFPLERISWSFVFIK